MGSQIAFALLGAFVYEATIWIRMIDTRSDPRWSGPGEMPLTLSLLIALLVRLALGVGVVLGADAAGFVCNDGTAFIVGIAAPAVVAQFAKIGALLGETS